LFREIKQKQGPKQKQNHQIKVFVEPNDFESPEVGKISTFMEDKDVTQKETDACDEVSEEHEGNQVVGMEEEFDLDVHNDHCVNHHGHHLIMTLSKCTESVGILVEQSDVHENKTRLEHRRKNPA
jgi:hypothetical protein